MRNTRFTWCESVLMTFKEDFTSCTVVEKPELFTNFMTRFWTV